MKFDDIIAELGEFGPYQRRTYFLMCLVAIPTALQTLAGVFIQATPDHRYVTTTKIVRTFTSRAVTDRFERSNSNS